MPDWSTWKAIEKPLMQANRSGEFSFTAPHAARFSVQIKFPDEPKERVYTVFRRLERSTYGEAFTLHILAGEERIWQGYSTHCWIPYEEENVWSDDWFDAKAGHRYTIRVIGNPSAADLRTLHPVVRVTYSPALEKQRHQHSPEKFLSVFLCVIGVTLTFGGASRIPLQGWFRTKS